MAFIMVVFTLVRFGEVGGTRTLKLLSFLLHGFTKLALQILILVLDFFIFNLMAS